MKGLFATALGVAATLGALGTPAYGAGAAAAPGSEAKSCVDLRHIDYTHVIDDQNILFYMYGGNIYLNRLPHPATGLDRHQPFMYRTSVSRVCKSDIITVLEDWGFGFTPGASTTLGKFEPIDAATANDLRHGRQVEVQAEPVESK
jgi:hypothetical protein